MGKVIADNFLMSPSSGPAFVQLASEFFQELKRNSARLPLVEALVMGAAFLRALVSVQKRETWPAPVVRSCSPLLEELYRASCRAGGLGILGSVEVFLPRRTYSLPRA